DIHLQADELGRKVGQALGASLRPAILDGDGSVLDPAEFAQSLYQGTDPTAVERSRVRTQESDDRQLCWLLRPRRERPPGRAADSRCETEHVEQNAANSRFSEPTPRRLSRKFPGVLNSARAWAVTCCRGASAAVQ